MTSGEFINKPPFPANIALAHACHGKYGLMTLIWCCETTYARSFASLPAFQLCLLTHGTTKHRKDEYFAYNTHAFLRDPGKKGGQLPPPSPPPPLATPLCREGIVLVSLIVLLRRLLVPIVFRMVHPYISIHSVE